ncbi:MAG: hypothetical protein HOV83_07210 [Catenulispora sp.]|nr:hypothetical protein [Catenulispora sp.]
MPIEELYAQARREIQLMMAELEQTNTETRQQIWRRAEDPFEVLQGLRDKFAGLVRRIDALLDQHDANRRGW